MKISTTGYDLKVWVNNFQLSYDDIGEGKTPILFLHGFPFSKAMWKDQLEYFKTTQRVIACDIRGFGASTDEDSHLSIDLFTEDLIKFMNTLEIDKAILCGLSMGGFISLNAMEKYPERFKALILCDTQCIADSPEVKEQRVKTIAQILTDGPAIFNEAFTQSVFSKSSLSTKKELVEQLRKVVFANSQKIITSGITALAERSDTCSALSSFNIPTLIICGREDGVTPLAQSEWMHETINDSTLQVIENAGHVSNLEAPELFNRHIQDFLLQMKNDSK